MFFVYILYCPVTELSYVGQTDHLIFRYYRHRDGMSRWTRRMESPVVIHWEALSTRGEALKREKQLKSGQGFEQRKNIIAAVLADSAQGPPSGG
ncbi:MAG: GIY-YIG nuclease family protein [Candidatus Pacebacteria bacterium]|nr:GIY-YIG nuclease family protein [Candidatus Paceibacterota bacterium]